MSRTAAVSLFRQYTAARRSAHLSLSRAHAARALAPRSGLIRLYSTQQEQELNENGAEAKKEGDKYGESVEAESEKREEGSSSSSVKEESDATQSQQNGAKTLTRTIRHAPTGVSRLRYLQADFLNLQRNAAREREQTKDFAITRFAGDLLETVDVLSLALKSVPESALNPSETETNDVPPAAAASQSASPSESEAPSSSTSTPSSDSSSSSSTTPPKSASDYLRELHHGVEMTHRLLLQTLFKYGVKPFDPTGDAFDPNRHEALYQVPIPGKKPGTVIDCQKTGYTIKDRTLRAAQVGVASEPPSP
ncbi:GrpE nucleotide exchange factor [Sanghuangporus baumii]|uniref:GrpE protein homolog, mitochondrial n=1 Tax=Sanghuangporus baumii TaxID=108892 RepID=A0A9Q5HQE3_SANBA|nr:GrpE nucleotide exchange factor [Sanghuangporus baumii]